MALITPLGKYIFVFLNSIVPITNHSYYEQLETTRVRYESVAETIATVSQESPLFVDDSDGVKTATILASIALAESHIRADVDTCKIGGDKDKNGNYTAWTLWQMHLPKKVVCSSRLVGARHAREFVRLSFKTCERLSLVDRLSFYTDGICKKDWRRSQDRIKPAIKWVAAHPFVL